MFVARYRGCGLLNVRAEIVPPAVSADIASREYTSSVGGLASHRAAPAIGDRVTPIPDHSSKRSDAAGAALSDSRPTAPAAKSRGVPIFEGESESAPLKLPADSIGNETRSGTPEGIDAVVARLAVEQGLATAAEVDECRRQQGGRRVWNVRTLAELLVKNKFITESQLARLRTLIDAERTGRKIPGYKMLGQIGKGASAVVFKARQMNLDRLVAIKVMHKKSTGDTQSAERFYAEARAAAALNHPNIVQAHDVGSGGDFHYFVMEFVEGVTVHDLIQELGTIHEETALDIIIAVADALQHAHQKGLVHRDVKPKNIIMAAGNIPKLADLGLARALDDKATALAEKGQALGTPFYISPEQVRGDEYIGPESDIYSLGATFFYMVTGRVPFEGRTAEEVMNKHMYDPLTPPTELKPDLTPGLSEVIEKMLSKDAKARYADCADLLLDLRAWKAVIVLKQTPPTGGRKS